MPKILLDDKSWVQLDKLVEKMDGTGQNISCHLEGMVHSRFLTYWDYIQLEILLQLQQPQTNFPDEKVFIIYHQITELYFKLILNEIDILSLRDNLSGDEVLERMRRINRYMENLVHSFTIMVDGLDNDEFMLFRTSLAPASGFQSVQYRLIEIYATSLRNLVDPDLRHLGQEGLKDEYDRIYWKKGAVDRATGKKDLSLVRFEQEYDEMLLDRAVKRQRCNLNYRYGQVEREQGQNPDLVSELRKFDELMNIDWRLAHYRSAVRHLRSRPDAGIGTGGTNWQTYLPPRFQRVIFFPDLWTQAEINGWGKSFIEKHILQ
jgi:tryptophan 2,3-dioxygenase